MLYNVLNSVLYNIIIIYIFLADGSETNIALSETTLPEKHYSSKTYLNLNCINKTVFYIVAVLTLVTQFIERFLLNEMLLAIRGSK